MTAKIFADAGHGGKDSGATGNGLYEKDLTLKLSQYFTDILTNDYQGVVVKQSRDHDKSLSLAARSDMANEWGADYLVSFHINAFNGSAHGFESYVYNGNVNDSTKDYQDIIHDEIMKVNGLSDRGKKEANFHMVREPYMSAVLTENGFIDSPDDAEKLKDDDYIYQVAKGHAEGVAKMFDLKKVTVQTDDTNNQNENVYEVIAGTFSKYKNAKDQENHVIDKGFEAYIKQTEDYYEVIVGTFKQKDNARDQAEKVQSKGIEVYVK